MMIIGCDFHPRYQQVAAMNQETGEIVERRLSHVTKEAQAFYESLPPGARIGMEATCAAQWFERLLGPEGRSRLDGALAGDDLEQRIDIDLSVAGLRPPLHLPVLAGLAQGPGFPNLSCLGLLSDRILRRYVKVGAPASTVTERRELA